MNASGSQLGTTAIIGGGISGLTVAYELARHGAPFMLFEGSGRLGGIIETVRTQGFVIECGPDSWVTEKPWARELAVELGLEKQILPSNDDRRRTYLVRGSLVEDSPDSPSPVPIPLVPIPDDMRMMVPLRWRPILRSPLFSWRAKLAYLREPRRARELKAAASGVRDESVAEFVRRHFGEEAAATIAGPLLAGVFGGDIEDLSVRAVMPVFASMEREYGSLIAALRQTTRAPGEPRSATFTTLAGGLGSLVERLATRLPAQSLCLNQTVHSIAWDGQAWRIDARGEHRFHSVVLATPPRITRDLLMNLGEQGARMAGLLPRHASSAIIVAFAFEREEAARMSIPRGFGFLVPPPVSRKARLARERSLLACTFVDQKFSHRAPDGAVLLRAFFGGDSAEALAAESDEAVARLARQQLAVILERRSIGVPAAVPVATIVRRWPLSLPQYEVDHLDRIAELESLVGVWPGLSLAGNAYHGVGLPDLIREARATARTLLDKQRRS